MFNGLFGWLRQSVRAAVIGGVQDAIKELTTADAAELPEGTQLRLSFRPEKEEASPAKRRKVE